MTEEELAALERWLATTAADERSYLEEEAIPALIAEVRRLRVAYDTADDSWAVSLNTVIAEQKREIARLNEVIEGMYTPV